MGRLTHARDTHHASGIIILSMPLSVAEFVRRWKMAALTERASAQSHFIDLCDMLGQPHPAAEDQAGDRYTFEKHVSKLRAGDKGFADVWMRDHFAWEYKGRHKDLHRAYVQLADYREDLGNPPLLVVCDLDRFQVHTNFTSTNKRIYSFDLDDLNRNTVTATCPIPPLEVLRALFGDTSVLRPDRTAARVTEDAAKKFLQLAARLEIEGRTEKPTREQIAHFLMRVIFCLFADSIGLLPSNVFRDLVKSSRSFPRKFRKKLGELFDAMSDPDLGPDRYFGPFDIRWFNGGLFDDSSTIELNEGDMGILVDAAANLDWSHIEPAIFGTLFERSLDVEKRSLIGAHYTSPEDIALLVDPVILQPLRRRWETVQVDVRAALAAEHEEDAKLNPRQARLRTTRASETLLATWFEELARVRVLDPACGSGNFLYISLRKLLDLWKEAKDFALAQGMSLVQPAIVRPHQLFGIETDFYAHELASIVVWIGWLQWMHEHGELITDEPVLQKLDNIQHADAILRYDAEGKPYEPEWPEAEYIVGNPPFLGGKLLRRELGDAYVDDLFALYQGRVKAESDLVVYWFEKARAHVDEGRVHRAGLLATQAIRGGANRNVLKRIEETGNIFWAWSDRKWMLAGAAVHVSMVAFDRGQEQTHELDGMAVDQIYANLSSGSDTTSVSRLRENFGICFMGTSKVGAFNIVADTALKMLSAPINVNGRPNSDVVRPWVNAIDVTRRPRRMYVIDFGTDMSETEAAKYQSPFEYIRTVLKDKRLKNNRETYSKMWWLHGEPRPEMRQAIATLKNYIVTPTIAKHRLFARIERNVLPDHQLYVFARSDDYFFGVLHSRIHEFWSLTQGTQLEDRPRYTPNTTFDTFPFPWPPGKEPQDDPRAQAIAAAAKNLVELRDRWLNPPDTPEDELKKRTLTNLYNARPQWLDDAHRTLDRAVFAAYGWPDDLTDQQILERLLALNHERAAAQAAAAPEKPRLKKLPGPAGA